MRSFFSSKLDPQGPLFEVLLRTGQISEKVRMSRAGAPFGRVRPGTARERKAHCAFMLVCAQSFSFDLVSARAACLCSAHDLAIASCCCLLMFVLCSCSCVRDLLDLLDLIDLIDLLDLLDLLGPPNLLDFLDLLNL